MPGIWAGIVMEAGNVAVKRIQTVAGGPYNPLIFVEYNRCCYVVGPELYRSHCYVLVPRAV